jgi:toxin CcdB
MAQFDVHAGIGRRRVHVVELQSDLLERLAARVVAPMIPGEGAMIISGLTPSVRFEGADYLLLMHQLASVPVRELQRPIGSVAMHQDAIKRALDILFLGI